MMVQLGNAEGGKGGGWRSSCSAKGRFNPFDVM